MEKTERTERSERSERSESSWKVQSESDPDKQYEVTRVGDYFTCSCPDCMFRNHECKHIKKIKMRLAGEKQGNKLF